MEEKKLPEALVEAQQAVALAPQAVRTNSMLGDVLSAMGRNEEARQAYETALHSAKTIEPEFQVGAAADLEKKLGK